MFRKPSRWSFVAVALVAMLLVSFGAAAQANPVTVKLWMHVYAPRVALDNVMIPKFEAANPNIKVEYTTVPANSWDTTLATALASGAGPDLFNADSFSVGQYYAEGTLAPIDPAAAGFTDQQSIYDSYSFGQQLLAGATFNNKLYGLPTELSAYACYTNNDLFAKAGLDPNKDFPTTWEDMKTVAEKMTIRDSSGALTQRGFDFNWSASIFMPLIFNAMVEQLGPSMIGNDYTANVDTPAVKQVMQYWYDWVNTWKLGGPQYTTDRTDFEAGKLAIDCDYGNWGVPEITAAGVKFTIHPVPRWAKNVNDSGMANYGYFLMVNSLSSPDVQAAAWKLAGYLTSFPQQYLDQGGLFQAKKAFVESDNFKNNPIMPLFLTELSKSQYHPEIAGFNEVSDALARMRDAIITGGADMDTTLANAQTEITGILQQAQANATPVSAAS